jgi:hypothetical protein
MRMRLFSGLEPNTSAKGNDQDSLPARMCNERARLTRGVLIFGEAKETRFFSAIPCKSHLFATLFQDAKRRLPLERKRWRFAFFAMLKD